MPYTGNKPGLNFQNVTKDTFSGNGSTTDFTLTKSTTGLDCEVFVENVQQEPSTAYSIAGKTLSFTGAPPAGTNNIYVLIRGKATVKTNSSERYNATLFQNPRTITEDIALDAGFNATMAGPVTISSGVTLGVPTNSRLVIV
jgi:hypothetical protein